MDDDTRARCAVYAKQLPDIAALLAAYDALRAERDQARAERDEAKAFDRQWQEIQYANNDTINELNRLLAAAEAAQAQAAPVLAAAEITSDARWGTPLWAALDAQREAVVAWRAAREG